VDFASSQDVAPSYPEIPPEAFEQGVQFVQTDGWIAQNAEAAFCALAELPAWRWPLWAYRFLPGVRPATEALYRLVANHRGLFSRLDRWWVGPDPLPPGFRVTRWIFLRFLALIYLAAFGSFWVQAPGLIGSEGILPMEETLAAISGQLDRLGETAPPPWRSFPTIFWWGAGDIGLHAVCGGGVVIALMVFAGVLQPLGFVLLWAGYLSLCTVGGVFLSYQWDALLLETGFLAIFFSPWQLSPSRKREAEPSLLMVWLYRWLSFRLLWGSGLVKIASGDSAWWPDLTAMAAHYETQPLPNPLSWYAHHLPMSSHRCETATVLVLELLGPLLVFLPRVPRRWGGAVMIGLQLCIFATGNYTFFNLLTIALCLWWFDDGMVPRRLRAAWMPESHLGPSPTGRVWSAFRVCSFVVRAALAIILISVGFYVIRSQVSGVVGRFGAGEAVTWPTWVRHGYRLLAPFSVVGRYGLFAVMTTQRSEIMIEGSRDGRDWRAYRFRFKPGPLDRRPAQVAPHQPRLDWQLWFAALGSVDQPRTRNWFLPLMQRLLEGSPAVLDLLDGNPFPEGPPRWVRAMVYDYRFADPDSKRETGTWWIRSAPRMYCPPLRLPQPERTPNRRPPDQSSLDSAGESSDSMAPSVEAWEDMYRANI
jgi:hypothetical protein